MGRRNEKDAMNPLRVLMPLGLVFVRSLAVVVVAAVAFLFVRRRGRRMAPSMPPQAPPPGTP